MNSLFQLNRFVSSFSLGGDPITIYRVGLWNPLPCCFFHFDTTYFWGFIYYLLSVVWWIDSSPPENRDVSNICFTNDLFCSTKCIVRKAFLFMVYKNFIRYVRALLSTCDSIFFRLVNSFKKRKNTVIECLHDSGGVNRQY